MRIQTITALAILLSSLSLPCHARDPAMLMHRVNASSSSQATLTSPNGKAVVDGDVIEVHNGEITVNGVPYGRAPSGTVVRYEKENGAGRLYVGKSERKPAGGQR